MRRIVLAVLVALVCAACGGDDSPLEIDAVAPASSTPTTSTSTVAPSTTTTSTTTAPPPTTTVREPSHRELLAAFGVRLEAGAAAADVAALVALRDEVEEYRFATYDPPRTSDELESLRALQVELTGAVAQAELQSGQWGAPLDAIPPGPLFLVDVIDAIAVVSPDGLPIGWLVGDPAGHEAFDWSTFSDDVDAALSERAGTNCRAVPGSPDDAYIVCDLPDFGDDGRMAAIFASTGTGFRMLTGPAWGPYEEAPQGAQISGAWLDVLPGPDGHLLGQWSGECEVPSAHLIDSMGEQWAVVIVDGHPSLAPKHEAQRADLIAPASGALGWLPDGRAAISVFSGPCSLGDIDGVYAFDPVSGAPERLLATSRPVVLTG